MPKIQIMEQSSLPPLEVLMQWGRILQRYTKRIQQRQSKKHLPAHFVFLNGLTSPTRQAVLLTTQAWIGCKIFKMDLHVAMGSYIGETEKNLLRLLAKAERQQAILFFDEADALFGKAKTTDAHDRYANQEVSYLFEKLSAYPGMVIMATSEKWKPSLLMQKRFQEII